MLHTILIETYTIDVDHIFTVCLHCKMINYLYEKMRVKKKYDYYEHVSLEIYIYRPSIVHIHNSIHLYYDV